MFKTLLTWVVAILTGVISAFIGTNLAANCQTWDKEQWTAQSFCVTPYEFFISSIISKANARELSPREQQRDLESRISPSWEKRLEYRDKQRAREERAAQRKYNREWQRLEGPSWSEKDEELDHSDMY